MAETYHIYDWRSVPLRLLATLTAGLRENSRIVMLKSGTKVPVDTMLAASMADSLRTIISGLFTDGKEPPPSILDTLLHGVKEKDECSFSSGAEFDSARQKLLKKVKNNG